MTADSDSDSDLDFLAEIQNSRSNRSRTASRQPQELAVARSYASSQTSNELAKLKQEYWEKLGENEILRSQLTKNQADHQRNIGELLSRTAREKEEHHKEIEDIKKVLEKERIQHQFLLAELRLKNSGSVDARMRGGSPSQTGASHSASVPVSSTDNSSAFTSGPRTLPTRGSASNVSAAPKQATSRVRPANSALGDGFVLKKPRISPSGPGAPTATSNGVGNDSKSSGLNQSDSSHIVTFLINHQAPGFGQSSLQLLFDYKPPQADATTSSIGQSISASLSFGEFATKVVKYIEQLSVTFDNDATELLLSVLHDSLFLNLPFTSNQTEVSSRLCDLLIEWLKRYEPFPTFNELESELPVVRIKSARLLTSIIYAVDVLLAADWEFEVPYDLCRRILSFSCAPHLCARAIDLMAVHPRTQFVPLLSFQFPSTPSMPHVELLFSGLSDCSRVTAAELSRKTKYSSKFSKLAEDDAELQSLKRLATTVSSSAFDYMQRASIRLATALITSSSTSPSIDQYVMSLFSGSVDSYALNAATDVVDQCVFYLWCRDYTSLKQNLDASGTAELCVCLTKLVYDYRESCSTVEQARQLLQILSSSEETDRLFEVFEPLESNDDDDENDEDDNDDDMMIDA